MTTTHTNNHDHYIAVCHYVGLNQESMFWMIEDAIFEDMENRGFGYGQGYGPDAQDRDEAWAEANEIARAIQNLI